MTFGPSEEAIQTERTILIEPTLLILCLVDTSLKSLILVLSDTESAGGDFNIGVQPLGSTSRQDSLFKDSNLGKPELGTKLLSQNQGEFVFSSVVIFLVFVYNWEIRTTKKLVHV